MKKRRLITVVILALTWWLAANSIANNILLPYPWDVALAMFAQLQQSDFYKSILFTLFRLFQGLILALLFGVFSGYVCALRKRIDDYFMPIITAMKTIPNISFIIIALIWLGSEKSVLLITFLILFPIFFEAAKMGVTSVDKRLLDVLLMYPETRANRFKNVYGPNMLPYVLSSLKAGVSLGFKVAIMSEVLGQVQTGIGKSMFLGKLYLDTTAIFAWTVWIILIGYSFDVLLDFGIKIIRKKFDF
jgi:NitT/TauT family transport system permease protein